MSGARRTRVAKVVTAGQSAVFLLASQLQAMVEAGLDVTLYCNARSGGLDLGSLPVRVVHVPFRREPSPVSDLAILGTLYRRFRQERFDVVHTHTPKAGLLAPAAARLAGVPHVIHTVHGFMFHDAMPWASRTVFQAAERWTAAFCHALLFQSTEDVETAKAMRIAPPERLFYLGNGVDTSRFTPRPPEEVRKTRSELGLPADAQVVGFVGRLVLAKGFREFVGAARALREALGDRLHVLIVGPSEEGEQRDAVPRDELERIAGAPGFHVLGLRWDVERLYPVMDVLALPSYREGIPRTAMEAAACGVPVVATDIRGCREVVADGGTGLLVPVRRVRELVDAISALLADPARARAMGARGRERVVERFSDAAVNRRLLDIYQAVLHRRPAAGEVQGVTGRRR